MRNIALIGFMGAGKSTVAALLAKELGEELIETDAEIMRLAGLSSVNEIFDTKGEEYFRKLEKQVIKDSVKGGSSIISCGGGVVSDVESMEILKANAIVIFLNTSFNVKGQPIVNTPQEAISTFLGTGIQALFLENHLVTRRGTRAA